MTIPIPEQVLFIHNAGAGSWEWCVWQEIFSQYNIDCHLITLDANPEDLTSPGIPDLKQQILDFTRENHIECPIIVGAGMGGMLGIQLADALDASAVVLINPLSAESLTDFTEDPSFSAIHLTPDESGDALSAKTPGSNKLVSMQAQNNEINQLLPQPHCPCLILIGEGNDAPPPETGNELAARLDAEVFSFGGTSHIGALLGFEAKAIARQVCQWLALRDD